MCVYFWGGVGARLRAEYNLDCNACVEELPAEESSAECDARTVEDDTADEMQALFNGKPRKLYEETNFLFATDKVIHGVC